MNVAGEQEARGRCTLVRVTPLQQAPPQQQQQPGRPRASSAPRRRPQSAPRNQQRASELFELAAHEAEAGGGGGPLWALARTLKNHLRGIGERDGTRQKLEDAHRCFYLLQKAEEWASDAAQIVDYVSHETSETAQKRLRLHMMAHPSPSHSQFAELMQLCSRLQNQKLSKQCQDAEAKCSTALTTIRAHLADAPLDENFGWSCRPDEATLKLRRRTLPPVAANSHLQQSCVPPPVDPEVSSADAAVLKTRRVLLLIARELVQTERDYVRALEYIIENYIPELLREDIPQALRGQRNVIFGNVEKIFDFHNQFFLEDLEKCEDRPLSIVDCFMRHESKFYLYALYSKNKPKSDKLMAEYGNAYFRSKQLELGDKMDLGSYLLKPVQRMGKYALLLQQMVRAVGGAEEAQDLAAAEAMVRFQLQHGNDLLAMDSLYGGDINLKEQGRLLRQNELLVGERGQRRLRRRQVFLFEEVVVMSKARRPTANQGVGPDYYVYKSSIKTSDLGLTAQVADSPLKFELWFRKRRQCDTVTFLAASPEIKDAWTREISLLLWRQAAKNKDVRLTEMSNMGIGNKPCLDIRPSGHQIQQRSVSLAEPPTGSRLAQLRRRPHSVDLVCLQSSALLASPSNSQSSDSSTQRSNTLLSHSSLESGIVSDLASSTEDAAPGPWEPSSAPQSSKSSPTNAK